MDPNAMNPIRPNHETSAVFSPAARWIWLPGEPSPVNAVVDFQGRFKLAGRPRGVRLRVSADSRYRLHVNGVRVGFGPGRGYPGHYSFDEHDITALLRPGENVVDLRVLHWGEGTFHGLVLQAGVICEVSAGGKVLLASSAAWRARLAAAYERVTPRIACQLGFEEQVDLALEQGAGDGQPATGKGWLKPVEIGPDGCAPWGKLQPRGIPQLGGETVPPVAVRDLGHTGHEGLLLALRAGRDLGCEMRAANTEKTDGIFATCFHVRRGGALRIRRTAMYGGPLRVFLDGREVKLAQGRFDLEATVDIRRGNHLLLLDWQGLTHDTDVAVSLSGIKGLAKASMPGFEQATWIFSKAAKSRARIRKAASPADLLERADWRAVSAENTPQHDVYMAMSTREAPPAAEEVSTSLPLKIAAAAMPRRVVLDFGAQRNGWLELGFHAQAGAVIDLMGVEAWGAGGPQFTELMNNTARIVCRGGRQRFESLVVRGLRHLILDIHGAVELLDATMRAETYPWHPRGRFLCSETRLNQIHELCAHTLRMSSMDVFVDATYEQTLWVGDTCSMMIPLHHYLQGEALLPERCLKMIAHSLERTPLVNSQVPSAWEDRLIPNWSFFWVDGVRSNFELTGNTAFLLDMLPALEKQADFVISSFNAEGLFEMHENVWHFLDWNGQADDHRQSGRTVFAHENCLALASLEDTAWLAAQAGDRKLAARMKSAAAKLRAAILRHFKIPGQNAFGETRTDGSTSPVITASTQICALRAGLFADPDIISHQVLAPPAGWIPTGTPWMWSLGALQACAHGHAAEVYRGIAAHWGRMLEQGATATWEMFEGRHRPGLPTRSWCHGWSAGPAWILAAYALGVRPAAPGWKKVIIDPQPGDLLWAEGTVPTPMGDLFVKWQLIDGKPRVEYQAPKGVSVSVVSRKS